MITNTTSEQIFANYNAKAEQMLSQIGYDVMNITDKNSLIVILAERNGLLYSDITPEYVLNYHKQLKKDILSQKCDEVIAGGFVASNGHTYRTTQPDMTYMVGQKNELDTDSSIATVDWRTLDAGYVTHTRAEWLQMYADAFANTKANLMKYRNLEVQIDTATTHAEILAVNWS